MRVIAETEDWFCLEKPPQCPQDDVVRAWSAMHPGIKFSCVYTLDEAIPGPLLLAKTQAARQQLKNAYGSDAFTLEFSIWGWLTNPACPDEWICNLSIAWDAHKRRAYPSKTHGKKSRTQFHLQQRCGSYALFTGRTHYLRPQQLSVHAHFSHFDILGDTLWTTDPHWVYPPLHWKKTASHRPLYPYLHLALTALTFPYNDEEITLQQPPPSAWKSIQNALQQP